ncbi:hypothetical protein TcasGA2_TC034752 [Tribolium castaneum]|uniref:Uncharacterized protein n=1 Tax=Tribolium castaneum TaxID=7070 RepID=A0A139WG00_TRICA|nr:hypothetical protein TcasGA2_TC034752 [Tribolium castaneum]
MPSSTCVLAVSNLVKSELSHNGPQEKPNPTRKTSSKGARGELLGLQRVHVQEHSGGVQMPDVRRPEGHLDAQAAYQPAVGGPAGRQPIPTRHQPTEEKGQEGDEETAPSTKTQECGQKYGADTRSHRQQRHGHHHRVQAQEQVHGDDLQLQLFGSWIALGEQHGREVKGGVSVTRRTMTPDVDFTLIVYTGGANGDSTRFLAVTAPTSCCST